MRTPERSEQDEIGDPPVQLQNTRQETTNGEQLGVANATEGSRR
jgi:hypothetical protein